MRAGERVVGRRHLPGTRFQPGESHGGAHCSTLRTGNATSDPSQDDSVLERQMVVVAVVETPTVGVGLAQLSALSGGLHADGRRATPPHSYP